jgi:hypothetical protein
LRPGLVRPAYRPRGPQARDFMSSVGDVADEIGDGVDWLNNTPGGQATKETAKWAWNKATNNDCDDSERDDSGECPDDRHYAKGGAAEPDPALIRRVFNAHLNQIRAGKPLARIDPHKFAGDKKIAGNRPRGRADRRRRS